MLFFSLITLPAIGGAAGNATRLGATKVIPTFQSTSSTGYTNLATPDLVKINGSLVVRVSGKLLIIMQITHTL